MTAPGLSSSYLYILNCVAFTKLYLIVFVSPSRLSCTDFIASPTSALIGLLFYLITFHLLTLSPPFALPAPLLLIGPVFALSTPTHKNTHFGFSMAAYKTLQRDCDCLWLIVFLNKLINFVTTLFHLFFAIFPWMLKLPILPGNLSSVHMLSAERQSTVCPAQRDLLKSCLTLWWKWESCLMCGFHEVNQLIPGCCIIAGWLHSRPNNSQATRKYPGAPDGLCI